MFLVAFDEADDFPEVDLELRIVFVLPELIEESYNSFVVLFDFFANMHFVVVGYF